MTVAAKFRLGTRRQPERSRAAILKAAVREFSEEGIAGARTDAIARSAGVNKALLYYYFKDKEALYQAVLDEVFSGVRKAVEGALSQPLPPRDRLAAYVHAHFDYIASNPLYSRIVHAELLRAARDPSRLQRVAKQYFQPVFVGLAGLLREGEAAGEFRRVDAMQFIPSMIAVIVFYFITAPITRVMTGHDPFSAERLASRREAIVDFVSHALFTAARPSHRATRGERN
jgi:TetR/AcrR family transcriptional regulator